MSPLHEVAAPGLHMWVVLALTGGTILSFALEKIPFEATAALSLTILLVFFELEPLTLAGGGTLGARPLLAGFADPALITVLALLVIGQAIIQTGALEWVGTALHRASRGSVTRATAFSLLPVAFISSVLNNTPMVVIFIPIVSTLAERLGVAASRLLMPLSFAAILGGMTTLIGSSTNLLVAGVSTRLGQAPLGFFDFVVPGAVLAGVGLVYVLLVAPRLLPERRSAADDAVAGGRQFIAQVEVLPGSDLIGAKMVAGLVRGLPNMTVRLVRRDAATILPPFEDLLFVEGDIIVVAATRKALTEALRHHPDAFYAGERAFLQTTDGTAAQVARGGDQALAEVMVAPASRLIGQTLPHIGFRTRHQCHVVGLQRRSRMIRAPLTDIRLEAGDMMLVQGEAEAMGSLRHNRDVILIEWSQTELPSYQKARRASAIFLATVALAASGVLPIVVAAVAGATAMMVSRCLNVRQAARSIDRRVVMIVGATLALGTALHETGGAVYLAGEFLSLVVGAGPATALAALFLLIALVTNILSNNAAAVLFTPVALSVAGQLGVDATPFLFAVIFGASCSFASPVGYQTNLLVMASGHYRFTDFIRAGTPLILLLWITYSLFAAWYYDLAFHPA